MSRTVVRYYIQVRYMYGTIPLRCADAKQKAFCVLVYLIINRLKLKLRITNTARTRSRQFGPRGGATAHHTKEKHSELGGKIVRARKYFCTVIWGLFWPFLKICSRSGFAQFKNQPGYHYTIVIEYIFSRGFQ